MIHHELDINDYEKIVEFITKSQDLQGDYRNSVLNNLSSLFGYNHLTFFLSDKKGKFKNPVTSNISPYLTETYDEYYHRTDIFHTASEISNKYNKSVISILDIMPYKDFENTEYYTDFLKKDNLYYEIAMPLRIGSSILGGIGVFNPKECGNFTSKDIAILEKLSKIISTSLNNYIITKDLVDKENLFTDLTYQNPMGIIVLRNNNSICYYNDHAKEYCLDILNGKITTNPVKYVLDTLFIEGNFKKNSSSNSMYRNVNNYNITIVPSLITRVSLGIESFTYVYIAKNTVSLNNSFDYSKYKLTNREMEIVDLVFMGYSNKDIANELVISYNTVKTHIDNIFRKLNVDNRSALIYKIRSGK